MGQLLTATDIVVGLRLESSLRVELLDPLNLLSLCPLLLIHLLSPVVEMIDDISAMSGKLLSSLLGVNLGLL